MTEEFWTRRYAYQYGKPSVTAGYKHKENLERWQALHFNDVQSMSQYAESNPKAT